MMRTVFEYKSKGKKAAPQPHIYSRKSFNKCHTCRTNPRSAPLTGKLMLKSLSLSERVSTARFLQQTIGNQATQRIIQAKPSTGGSGEIYEQDAGRISQREGMPEPEVQLQRREGEEEETLRARHVSNRTTHATSDLDSRIQAMKGGGQPLPRSIREFYEPRFGYDFGQVRIHNDSRAYETTRLLNAKALTVGGEILFGKGQYNPGTFKGDLLLSHELTHVTQQGKAKRKVQKSNLDVRKTGGERLQGGFFDWLGRAAKKVGGAIWSGVKAVAGYGWNVIKSMGSLIWSNITETPSRIWRILVHLVNAPIGIISWFWDGLKKLFLNPSALGKWLLGGILSGAAWIGRLFTKLLDLVGIGERMDLLWQIIKVNTRSLTRMEVGEAYRVFKNGISYWKVRIDELSLIAHLGKWFTGAAAMGVTTFHTINFTRKISTSPRNSDMGWLIHELTHVAQYENVGSQYMGEALHAQATGGYTYAKADLRGKKFRDFNREQQGEIARDYYLQRIDSPTHPDHTLYQPRIDELRKGDV